MKIKSKVVSMENKRRRGEGRRGGCCSERRKEERGRESSGHRVDFELAGRGECLPARFECETPIVALFNRQPFEMGTPSLKIAFPYSMYTALKMEFYYAL